MKKIKVTERSILKLLAKTYNLDFCKEYGYYIGNPYYDNKDNILPSYMSLIVNGRTLIYELKYYDGCFNPYAVWIQNGSFGQISKEGKTQIIEVSTDKTIQYLIGKYGENFTMLT
jgi:hypothetical protein